MNRNFLNITAKNAISLAALAVTAVFVAAPAFATERMLPGRYETTQVKANDKSQTVTSCFTAEDAKTINDDVKIGRVNMEQATQKSGNGVCKITAYDFVGDTLSTRMVCSGNMTMITRQTFHGNNAFDSQTTTTIDGKIVQDMHFTSKRVGACK